MEAQKNLHNLLKMGVIKLTIAFHTIWDERSRDKVTLEYCISNNVCANICRLCRGVISFITYRNFVEYLMCKQWHYIVYFSNCIYKS